MTKSHGWTARSPQAVTTTSHAERLSREVPAQPGREVLRGQGTGQPPALRTVAPDGGEALPGRVVLDALRHDAHPEPTGEIDDGADDRVVARVLHHPCHEAAVDLDLADGQLP